MMEVSINALIEAIMELWGCVFCIIVLIALGTKDKRRKGRDERLLALMHLGTLILLFSDGMAWLFRGQPGTAAVYMTHISNFVVFFTGYVILGLYTNYVESRLMRKDAEQARPLFFIVYVLCVLSCVLLVMNISTNWFYDFDAMNRYFRTEYFPLTQITGIAGAVINGSVLLRNRKRIPGRDLAALSMYIVLPVIAMVIQIFYYGIAFLNIAITVAMLSMFMVSIRHNYEDIAVKEKELGDLKMQALIAQISPHFIYNSLNTIKYLCRKDPSVAATAVDELAGFLRGNLDVLEEQNCIPIEQELSHVENYLRLEKRRFQDRLNVVWNIEDNSFLIPPMTLQPLVENAVKHGIMRKLEGGTITITTLRYETGHQVIIADDGVGFDSSVAVSGENDGADLSNSAFISALGHAIQKDEIQSDTIQKDTIQKDVIRDGNRRRPHIGIKNVENRLELMCGGALHVHSEAGVGTKVVITLP